MENVPKSLRSEVNQIMATDDVASLAEGLAELITTSLKNIVLIAARVRRIEELGGVIEIDVPAMKYVRLIAYGQMLPELYTRLQGKSRLLDRLSSLPLPEQRAFAADEPVRVMETDGDFRQVRAMDLTTDEISQVFSRGAVRTDAEQVGFRRRRMDLRVAKKLATDDRNTAVVVDRKRGGIMVKETGFISAAELGHLMAELSKRR